MTEKFKREPRYVVLKIKDIHEYLSAAQIEMLQIAGETIAEGRSLDDKKPFNAVVVEQDWPEFEPVWAMIEARMTGDSRWQERVITEKAELDARLEKLNTFLDKGAKKSVDDAELRRLFYQSAVMDAYSRVLTQRIAAFKQ